MLPEIALPSACPVNVGVAQDNSIRNGKPAILRSGHDHTRPSCASRAIHEIDFAARPPGNERPERGQSQEQHADDDRR